MIGRCDGWMGLRLSARFTVEQLAENPCLTGLDRPLTLSRPVKGLLFLAILFFVLMKARPLQGENASLSLGCLAADRDR